MCLRNPNHFHGFWRKLNEKLTKSWKAGRLIVTCCLCLAGFELPAFIGKFRDNEDNCVTVSAIITTIKAILLILIIFSPFLPFWSALLPFLESN